MNHGYHYLSFYYILSSLGVPSLACVFLVFNLLTYLSTSLASHTLFMPPPCLEFTLNLTNILSSSSFIIPISLQSFNFFYHQIFFSFYSSIFFFLLLLYIYLLTLEIYTILSFPPHALSTNSYITLVLEPQITLFTSSCIIILHSIQGFIIHHSCIIIVLFLSLIFYTFYYTVFLPCPFNIFIP